MKTQTSFIVAIVLMIVSTACKNGSESRDKAAEPGQAAPLDLEKAAPGEKLIGKWIQPIPGRETEKQGFRINPDGTASSINMHTLVYEKWELKGDTLLMWNHTTGVKVTGQYIDTAIIKQITDSTLILTRKGNIYFSYSREN